MSVCPYCDKKFVNVWASKKFCSYHCCIRYNALKRVKETFRLNDHDKAVYKKIKELEAKKC